MKKVRVTKRQLGAYVRRLLRESQTASQLISVDTSSTSGVAGISYNARGTTPLEILDPGLSFNFLSMVSKGSIGIMGDVFEDIAQYVSLPKQLGSSFDNLNVTFEMGNSPAADIGLGFADAQTVTTESNGNFNYELNGQSWSVKSTAGQSDGGFSTLATAVGQLAACGLIKTNNIPGVNLDSQPQCYAAMSSVLNPEDSVTFKMGLCYYKYNRNGNITYEPTFDPQDNELLVYTLSSPTVTAAEIKALELVGFSSAIGKSSPDAKDSLIQYPFTELGSCYNNTCKHVKTTGQSSLKTEKDIESYLQRNPRIQRVTRSAKLGPRPGTQSAPSVRKSGNGWTTAAIQSIVNYFKDEHDAKTAVGTLDYSQYSPGAPKKLSINLRNRVNKKQDLDALNGAIATSLFSVLMSTFTNKILSAGNIDSATAKSITTAYSNLAAGTQSIPVAPERMLRVIYEVYTPKDLLKEAINTLPVSYNNIKPDLILLIDQVDPRYKDKSGDLQKKFTDANFKRRVGNLLKSTIKTIRSTNPNFLSLKRIMSPVIDINSTEPTFKYKYIEPVIFKITRKADVTITNTTDENTIQDVYNIYEITHPDSTTTTVRCSDSSVEVTGGSQRSVTHAESTWGTSYSSSPPNLNLKIGSFDSLDIDAILQYSTSEINAAIALQNRLISNLITARTKSGSTSSPEVSNSNTWSQDIGQQIINPTDVQSAETDLFGPDNSLVNIRVRLMGERLTLEAAKNVLEQNAKKVEGLSKLDTRERYSTEKETSYLIDQTSIYREILTSQLNGTVVQSSVDETLRKIHKAAVTQFASAIFSLIGNSTDIQAHTPEERASIRSSISILLKYSGIEDDPYAKDIISNMHNIDSYWQSGSFIFERMMGEVTSDLTPVYYYLRALLYFGLAIKVKGVLGDKLGTVRILRVLESHIQSINNDLDTLSSQQAEVEISTESRLYESILQDLMAVSAKNQRVANQPKKIKLTKRKLNKMLRELFK